MLRYGEKEIQEFDPEKDLEIWENKNKRDYLIKMTLPEFCCLCPRSGYPDFATIYIEYTPENWVVELKAIKLYINSFMNRHISHEDSINEIYTILEEKLKPKYMKIVGDFNPRGNVHTVIEIDSNKLIKTNDKVEISEKSDIIEAIKEEFRVQKESKKTKIKENFHNKRESFKDKKEFSDKKIDGFNKKRDSFTKLNTKGLKPKLVKKDDKS